MNFSVNCNNSIRLIGSKKIYIDPYEIKEETHDADYIFCTHSHYDHFSPEDIKKVLKSDTKIITVQDAKIDAEKLVGKENVLIVEPNQNYTIDDISFPQLMHLMLISLSTLRTTDGLDILLSLMAQNITLLEIQIISPR